MYQCTHWYIDYVCMWDWTNVAHGYKPKQNYHPTMNFSYSHNHLFYSLASAYFSTKAYIFPQGLVETVNRVKNKTQLYDFAIVCSHDT